MGGRKWKGEGARNRLSPAYLTAGQRGSPDFGHPLLPPFFFLSLFEGRNRSLLLYTPDGLSTHRVVVVVWRGRIGDGRKEGRKEGGGWNVSGAGREAPPERDKRRCCFCPAGAGGTFQPAPTPQLLFFFLSGNANGVGLGWRPPPLLCLSRKSPLADRSEEREEGERSPRVRSHSSLSGDNLSLRHSD